MWKDCFEVTPVAGAILATGSGSLVAKQRAVGLHYLKWFSNQTFQFDAPSAGNLAVLVNTAYTAETGARNNARYIRQDKPLCVKVTPCVSCFVFGNVDTDTRCRYVPQNLSRLEKRFWLPMVESGWAVSSSLQKSKPSSNKNKINA
jgi:hypothetical protein